MEKMKFREYGSKSRIHGNSFSLKLAGGLSKLQCVRPWQAFSYEENKSL
jgi:hypothetical protein